MEKRDVLIETLETEENSLKERCHDATEHAQIAAKARDALQQEYDRVCSELVSLGEQVEIDGAKGAVEIQQYVTIIDDLRHKLTEAQEQHQTAKEEVSIVNNDLYLTLNYYLTT